MALTYEALQAHVQTVFSKYATSGEKITHADLESTINKVLDYVASDGEWEPVAQIAIATSKASEAAASATAAQNAVNSLTPTLSNTVFTI